ncbi:NrfD/PsrC family molybdoenzyme membrane anchor subunit [Actinomycetospora cinnamomea]|uniref:Polysulfide reductase NrfD n=1 Tax=Actinomycetospora cinnamomea TaxID=663609 RepID=A0A2U1F3W3_9PSEU|nr:NrfD/PsrC family molybdoenzyme membrane anchor subunit [Actinomycetospora cinnamomea]PVZ06861.1 polysulfide reductase NrfD [Actinomycetospora cinnamomea]
MSTSDVTRDGLRGAHPEREATTGVATGRRGRRRGEQPRVEAGAGSSYYGLPVLNQVTWETTDIGGYLYLGGLAGASSVLAAGAELTDRPVLARATRASALGAVGLSLVALIHDLGRPERFLHMLRVAKPSSPMNVGSWLLTVYGPVAGVAAAADIAGVLPRTRRAATLAAAALGPAVASYTAVLISDTAVPAWHDGYREMPYLFVGSGATAAAGLGMIAAPPYEAGPARRTALVGAVLEVGAGRLMQRRLGMVAEPYEHGRSGALVRAGEIGTTVSALAAQVVDRVPGGRGRAAAVACGAALMVSSALTRFGIFLAGKASAADPRYTVEPQRRRLTERRVERGDGSGAEGAGG